ncbi:MAG TPA: tetratricopeptide repeat protein [Methylomirabilota bacterium]|nr:tetratricopeptide repeat protein [Methylomirabilota bacterium]
MSRPPRTPGSLLGPRPWLQAALLTVLAAALLAPGLGAGFIWDDLQQIVASPTIDDPAAPARYFALNVVESYGSEGRGADGVDTYRPLFFVALWAIHAGAGADPFWFHLAVLVAHLGVCLLLWAAARRFIGSDLAAASVFAVVAVHPVTAEAYLWASALSEPLAAAGLLGAALILDRWGRGDRVAAAAAAAGAVMLLGLLAKEAVLAALPAVSVYLWRVRGVRPRALVGPWLAATAFLVLRVAALGGLQATGSGGGQRLDAVRNLPVLVVDGLRALVTLEPVGIRQLYWAYRDLGWTASLAAAAALLLLAAGAWRLRRTAPLLPTALAVTVCMLAPVALIATVPGWGGFGRYLYLPWGFLALALAELGARARPVLAARRPWLGWVPALLAVVFLGFQVLGLQHALAVYHNQESLARAAIELQPDAPDGWLWLGNHHVEAGDLPAAARCYAEAVALAPGLFDARHNLAAALLALDRPAEALEHARAAAEIHGVTPEGAVVAASACLQLGRWDEAGRWLDQGLAAAPEHPRLLELRARWLEAAPTGTQQRSGAAISGSGSGSDQRSGSAISLPPLLSGETPGK